MWLTRVNFSTAAIAEIDSSSSVIPTKNFGIDCNTVYSSPAIVLYEHDDDNQKTCNCIYKLVGMCVVNHN